MLRPVGTYSKGVLDIHTKITVFLFFLWAYNSRTGTLATFAVIHMAH
jgi:hypothetical protein